MRLTTLGDFLNWAERSFIEAKLFFGHGTDNAWDEAVALARFVLKLSFDADRSVLDRVLRPAERKQLLALVEARVYKRIPLPYLSREAYFAGLKFYVDERVIIPRSPIAELILKGFDPWWKGSAPRRILDLCCGSACIAIACAKAFPELQCDAVDISIDALQVAAHNVALYGLESQVHLLKADLLEACLEPYDMILSNPPYVSVHTMLSLPSEYAFEPQLALEAGVDGLLVVDRILKEAKNHLNPKGLLIVEVGPETALLMEARYPQLPFVWLDFEEGAEGVFLLEREALP